MSLISKICKYLPYYMENKQSQENKSKKKPKKSFQEVLSETMKDTMDNCTNPIQSTFKQDLVSLDNTSFDTFNNKTLF